MVLFLAGMGFVVWKFTFWDIRGFSSLGLNILGFFVMAIGAGLFRMKSEEKVEIKPSAKKSKAEQNPKTVEKEDASSSPKTEDKPVDYSRYMPK